MEFAQDKAVTTVVVELTTNDGKTHTKRLSHWKGDPENPATKEELQAKFRKITSKIIKQNEAEKIIDLVENLETLKDIRPLGKLIRRT